MAKEPVGRRLPNRSGKVFRAAGPEVERGLPANLAVDLGICSHDGKAMGHRLDERITKGLNQRGRNEDIGVLIEFLRLLPVPAVQELDLPRDLRLPRQLEVLFP